MNTTARIFWSSLRTHLQLTLARPTFQIILLIQPILLATITYMMYRLNGATQNFASFVVLGAGLGGIWSSIVFSSVGDISRERFYGTLSSILTAPTSLMVVMFGKLAANSVLACMSLVVSFLFSYLVLGVSVAISHPFAFLISLALFLLSTNMFALTLSSMFMLSRSTSVMQNFLEYPILIVAGIFFSVETLPVWLQATGWLLPLTWGSSAIYWSLAPSSDHRQLNLALMIECGLAVLYGVLSFVLFHIIERRVRITASLDIS